jgi:hypothetical protein
MTIDRRALLKGAALPLVASALPRPALATDADAGKKADYTLHIANGLIEGLPQADYLDHAL